MTSIILLHGAMGTSKQFLHLIKLLDDRYHIFSPDFPGHNGTDIPEQQFSISLFEKSVIEFMDKNRIKDAYLFGYSMGGYVALSVAGNYPAKVHGVITLGTKFNWTVESAFKEARLLNPETVLEKVPAFAQKLEKDHSPSDWKVIMNKTRDMISGLGENHFHNTFYKTINCPVKLMVGDTDKMVSISETEGTFENLQHGEFKILPETQHLIENVDAGLIVEEIEKFIHAIEL